MDILCNYQDIRAARMPGLRRLSGRGRAAGDHEVPHIHVVYTKEAETADQYIEKVVHEIGRKYHVTVVTSDGVEQVVTLGQGGTLISAREFEEDIKIMRRQLREEYLKSMAAAGITCSTIWTKTWRAHGGYPPGQGRF